MSDPREPAPPASVPHKAPRPTMHLGPLLKLTPLPVPVAELPDDDDLSEERTKVTKIKGTAMLTPAVTNPDGFLLILYPPSAGLGQRIAIPVNTSVVIGRHPDCNFQINDDSVSRRHAEVANDGNGNFTVKDLGSTNGTHVNDAPIRRLRSLANGDRLRIGTVLLKFLTGNDIEAAYHDDVYKLTISDALTETYNKRYLLDFLDREIEKARRAQRSMCFVMIDIDKFKMLNDTYGHLVGDLVLREVARRIASTVRKGEVFARYGGEEFAVVLPETPIGGAIEFAERARSTVCASPFEAEGNRMPVTISLGVMEYTTPFPDLKPEDLISRADAKLYEAKDAGRNCVKF